MSLITANSAGYVTSVVRDKVALISFYHPKGNSLSRELLLKLADAITVAGIETVINAVVLRADGKGSFCAGASFDELCALRDQSAAEEFFLGFYNLMTAIIQCPVPVVAQVNGKVVGGGVGVVAASDYSVASADASARLSEITLGIGPFVIGPVVAKKIGVGNFETMMFGAEWCTAEWCERVGLYSSIAGEGDGALDNQISSLLSKLQSSPREALVQSKRLCRSDFSYSEQEARERAAIVGALALSPECQERLTAFRKK
jgi:methylglutaconyl-CoA hydratase